MTLLTDSAISVTSSAQKHWRRVPEARRRATLNVMVAVLVAIIAGASAAFFLASGLEGSLAGPAGNDHPPVVMTQPAASAEWDPHAPALPARAVLQE